MASSATSATSFELIEDQTLTVEEVEMASQEAQDIRARKAAVAAGLVLDEPEAPPSASATDVMKDLSSALERLRVAFATPTPGLGALAPPRRATRTWGMRTARSGPHHRRRRRRHPRRTHEETEGLRGGFSEGYVSGQQTCHLGAGGRKTRVLQAGGPPLAERHHGGGGGLPVSQVCWEEPHGGPGDPHLGGVRPDEDPAPPGGGLGFAVLEEQGVYRHPAHVQATSSCARHAEQGGQRQPSSAGSAPARSSPPPAHLGGQADLDPAAGMGKPGCRWPRWYPGTGRPQLGGRHGLGESPSKNGLGG